MRVQVTINLDDDVLIKLKKQADKKGRTPKQIAEELIVEGLKKRKAK